MLNSSFIKSTFYFLIASMLIVNVTEDYSAYQQCKIELEAGRRVDQTYQVLREIDAVRIAILETRLKRKLLPEVGTHLLQLELETRTSPEVHELAKGLLNFSAAQILAENGEQVGRTLHSIESSEKRDLAIGIQEDNESSAQSFARVVEGSIVDVFLILLTLALFMVERRSARKMQYALASALCDVEAANLKIKISLEKFKSAVHDLKNPLSSIFGLAEILPARLPDEKAVIQTAQYIQKASEITLNIVGKALALEDANVGILQPMKLVESLRETCTFLEPVAAKKQQVIKVSLSHEDLEFVAARDQVQAVFFNIIGNALKFSPPKSTVVVKGVREESFFEVQVLDQGPGFQKNDFSNLFLPGKSLSAKPSGREISTGFGLHSVKKTLQGMDSLIRIENAAGGGARITLRFPIQKNASQSVAA